MRKDKRAAALAARSVGSKTSRARALQQRRHGVAQRGSKGAEAAVEEGVEASGVDRDRGRGPDGDAVEGVAVPAVAGDEVVDVVVVGGPRREDAAEGLRAALVAEGGVGREVDGDLDRDGVHPLAEEAEVLGDGVAGAGPEAL